MVGMHLSAMMNVLIEKSHSTSESGSEGGTKPTQPTGSASVLKAFEEEQHALYDHAAKALGIKFWNKLGYSCTENPDEFGIDLIVEGQGRKFFSEVEIRLTWHGPKFPYETLELPIRKKKFAKDNCMFLVINNAQSHALSVPAKHVRSSPIIEKPNKKVPSGTEQFFSIPLELTQHWNLLAGRIQPYSFL